MRVRSAMVYSWGWRGQKNYRLLLREQEYTDLENMKKYEGKMKKYMESIKKI